MTVDGRPRRPSRRSWRRGRSGPAARASGVKPGRRRPPRSLGLDRDRRPEAVDDLDRAAGASSVTGVGRAGAAGRPSWVTMLVGRSPCWRRPRASAPRRRSARPAPAPGRRASGARRRTPRPASPRPRAPRRPGPSAIVPGRTVRPAGGIGDAQGDRPVVPLRTTVTPTAAVPPLGMLTWARSGRARTRDDRLDR